MSHRDDNLLANALAALGVSTKPHGDADSVAFAPNIVIPASLRTTDVSNLSQELSVNRAGLSLSFEGVSMVNQYKDEDEEYYNRKFLGNVPDDEEQDHVGSIYSDDDNDDDDDDSFPETPDMLNPMTDVPEELMEQLELRALREVQESFLLAVADAMRHDATLYTGQGDLKRLQQRGQVDEHGQTVEADTEGSQQQVELYDIFDIFSLTDRDTPHTSSSPSSACSYAPSSTHSILHSLMISTHADVSSLHSRLVTLLCARTLHNTHALTLQPAEIEYTLHALAAYTDAHTPLHNNTSNNVAIGTLASANINSNGKAIHANMSPQDATDAGMAPANAELLRACGGGALAPILAALAVTLQAYLTSLPSPHTAHACDTSHVSRARVSAVDSIPAVSTNTAAPASVSLQTPLPLPTLVAHLLCRALSTAPSPSPSAPASTSFTTLPSLHSDAPSHAHAHTHATLPHTLSPISTSTSTATATSSYVNVNLHTIPSTSAHTVSISPAHTPTSATSAGSALSPASAVEAVLRGIVALLALRADDNAHSGNDGSASGSGNGSSNTDASVSTSTSTSTSIHISSSSSSRPPLPSPDRALQLLALPAWVYCSSLHVLLALALSVRYAKAVSSTATASVSTPTATATTTAIGYANTPTTAVNTAAAAALVPTTTHTQSLEQVYAELTSLAEKHLPAHITAPFLVAALTAAATDTAVSPRATPLAECPALPVWLSTVSAPVADTYLEDTARACAVQGIHLPTDAAGQLSLRMLDLSDTETLLALSRAAASVRASRWGDSERKEDDYAGVCVDGKALGDANSLGAHSSSKTSSNCRVSGGSDVNECTGSVRTSIYNTELSFSARSLLPFVQHLPDVLPQLHALTDYRAHASTADERDVLEDNGQIVELKQVLACLHY